MNPTRALCSLAVCFSLTCLAAPAQEVVHALEGTVANLNQQAGTMDIQVNDGTSGSFKDLSENHVAQAVDKDLRAEVVPADKFSAKGDQVVLLYEGYGDGRTAVAVHDLGKTTVTRAVGTVERYDRHQHLLTLKTDAGKQAAFHINAKTIADTPTGAADGMKFDPSKGDHVQVAAATQNGNQIAVYVGPAD